MARHQGKEKKTTVRPPKGNLWELRNDALRAELSLWQFLQDAKRLKSNYSTCYTKQVLTDLTRRAYGAAMRVRVYLEKQANQGGRHGKK